MYGVVQKSGVQNLYLIPFFDGRAGANEDGGLRDDGKGESDMMCILRSMDPPKLGSVFSLTTQLNNLG